MRQNTLSNRGGGDTSIRGSLDKHLKIPGNTSVRQSNAMEDDDDDDFQKRASQLKSAYNVRSQDKREPMRVKSLQLLCFKLANHKKKIMMMMEKYVTQ